MRRYQPILSSVVAPMLFLLPTPASAQTTAINYKGNVLEVKNMADTFEILDPLTMDVHVVINNPNPVPQKFNNMNIYAVKDVEQKPSVTGDALRRDIIQLVSTHIKKDGEYRLMLDNVIIGDKGKIVYYNFDGVEEKQTIRTLQINDEKSVSSNYAMGRTDWKLMKNIPGKTLSGYVEKIINKAPTYKPAMVYNQPVPCQLDTKELQRPFTIKGGMVQY